MFYHALTKNNQYRYKIYILKCQIGYVRTFNYFSLCSNFRKDK